MKLQGRVKKGKQEPIDHHQTRHRPNSLFATDRLCYTAINEHTILHENLLLAHLSQRLIGELIGYSWSGVRPSVGVVRPSASSTMLKVLLLRNRFANQNQILCGAASLGRGTIFCSRHLGHLTIYGKNPLKIFFSGTRRPISTKLGL